MTTMNNKDRRYSHVDYEVREGGEEKDISIVGYALKFDKPSEDLGFIEYIDRSALDGVDLNNVVGLLNHDTNYVLGRSGKNMNLEVDEFGLRFTIEPTETSYTKDLIENMRQGLIDKCSFAFRIDPNDDDADTWERDDDGTITRTIKKIDRLFDVSVVTTPAYEDTEALLSVRSLNTMEQLKEDRKRELELMDMDLELLGGVDE